MLVPNILFDLILFGVLLLGALADQMLPQFAGVFSALAVVAALYIAAQEWSEVLQRRHVWTQEPLATAIALSTLGFIFFWWRDQSDLVLLVLSIGLMMAALMVAIATLGALGSVIKSQNAAPLAGWFVTVLAAFSLGVTGGVLVLFLGGTSPLFGKVLVLALGLFAWKIRETMRPPKTFGKMLVDAHSPEQQFEREEAIHAQPRWLIPQRGMLLDRILPTLVLVALIFIGAQRGQFGNLWTPTPPAVAANDNEGTP